MDQFKGVSERFRVVRVTTSGISERVVVQIGLDGLSILNADGSRTLNAYELSHISRWTMRDASLVLFTKTPVDVEERQLTLQGDSHVIRSLLDTLTSCCMQLAELLQSGQTSSKEKEIANSLHQLIQTGKSKKTTLPTMDSVEFWRDPEKCGWMQSQGEQIKTWRRRWFVLKQGYLFRFKDPDVSSQSKPRGVVDLSQVSDVRDGRGVTGRPNSIMLKTASSHVSYIAESETEQVEWMSALEIAVQKIVKHVAGVEDDPPAPAPSNDWVQRLENVFEASRPAQNVTVSVVGYDGATNKSSSGRKPSSMSGSAYPSHSSSYPSHSSSYPSHSTTSSSSQANDLMLNYGGSYPNVPSGNSYGSHTATHSTSSAPPHSDPYYPSYAPPSQAPAMDSGMHSGSYHNVGGNGFSVIDQVPAQQPSYPYLQQSSSMQQMYSAPPSAQAPAAPAAPTPGNGWTVHYSPDGRPYYHNTLTGVTQWDIPAGV